uniref:Uncharacterized protein n=1 Tax=Ananas comosus var. bracteatus TaxID=296719 RepID=A0A6V7P8S0_ANACO|nr:unnamed protein product [Ananas comosus var. bracteatus]
MASSTGNGGEGEAEAEAEAPLLPLAGRKAAAAAASSYYRRCLSHAGDELRSFRSCLRWMLLDQSEPARAAASWALFLLLGALVPAAAHLALVGAAAATPGGHRRAYDAAVQLSLSGAGAIAYLCLSAFVRRYGLRRFLFLDKLRRESERVRLGYTRSSADPSASSPASSSPASPPRSPSSSGGTGPPSPPPPGGPPRTRRR